MLIIFKNLFPFLRKRIDFERQNLIDEKSRSFKAEGLVADYCFEVSSEGEFEQVRPIIEFFLVKNKKIEIIFASPSVEKKCSLLASTYPQLIRIYRLPIASFHPLNFLYFQSVWQWVSASKVLFCRYDFYPELILLKCLNKKLILISATAKNPTWYKIHTFNFFELIIAANLSEAHYFREQFSKKMVSHFDFRIPRILSRASNADTVLNQCPQLLGYLDFLKSSSIKSRLIIGSAWESDLVIFKGESLSVWQDSLKSGKIHLLIVPHCLDPSYTRVLKNQLQQLFLDVPIYEISKTLPCFAREDFLKLPGIVFLNMSGLLCELYTKFEFSYVGGGHERSIHSVLEPFLSGSNVCVGPKIKRSTEYDFIKALAPSEIQLLNNSDSFYNFFIESTYRSPNVKLRQEIAAGAGDEVLRLINEIEVC